MENSPPHFHKALRFLLLHNKTSQNFVAKTTYSFSLFYGLTGSSPRGVGWGHSHDWIYLGARLECLGSLSSTWTLPHEVSHLPGPLYVTLSLYQDGLKFLTVRQLGFQKSLWALLVSHLLMSHWPRQVTWPSPEWEGPHKAWNTGNSGL